MFVGLVRNAIIISGKLPEYDQPEMKRYASANEFIAQHTRWQEILTALRRVLLSSGLEETIKWGVPVYTLGQCIVLHPPGE
jgi:uncharacterized protein YdeI (YjbR/CyaY-like superfamily)